MKDEAEEEEEEETKTLNAADSSATTQRHGKRPRSVVVCLAQISPTVSIPAVVLCEEVEKNRLVACSRG